MKKLIKILLYCVIVIILIFGILTFVGWKASSSLSISRPNPYQLLSASQSGDANACMKVPNADHDDINQCLDQISLNNLIKGKPDDISICDKMFDDSVTTNAGKINCYSHYYNDIGLFKKDPSVCTTIKNAEISEWCYQQYAIQTGNYSLCANVPSVVVVPENGNERDLCYAEFLESYSKPDYKSICPLIQENPSVVDNKPKQCNGL